MLRADGLEKLYGRHRALDGVDLEVPRAAIHGFLGPNGAGKTTTLRIAMGLLRADGGTVRVLGADPWRDGRRVRGDIGFLPTDPGLPGRMRGLQVLDHFTRLDGRPPVLRERICSALRLSDADLARPVRAYSRGMRQKLAIAQAVQHDPRLLILDEPTEGLDPLVQDGFFGFLRERRDAGRTVFLSSHVLGEVEALCDSVAIIRAGRIVDAGAIAELRGRRPRRVTVTLTRADAPVAVPGAAVVSRDGPVVVLSHTGDAAGLVAALADMPLADVRIEEPGLDEIFLSYYGQGDAP